MDRGEYFVLALFVCASGIVWWTWSLASAVPGPRDEVIAESQRPPSPEVTDALASAANEPDPEDIALAAATHSDSTDSDTATADRAVGVWRNRLALRPTEESAERSHDEEPPEFQRRDIDALWDIIDQNGLSEDSSAQDYDNGDGYFDALEFGDQVWEHGRLVELRTSTEGVFSFGYRLQSLPDSLANLTALRVLDLHTNEIRQLPETFMYLRSLETLILYRNRLLELPEDIWALRRLALLHLDDNELLALPETLGELENLEVLRLKNNPLLWLPESIGALRNLRILTLDRENGGLVTLPREMEDLRDLELLQVAGNSLGCDEEPPWFLASGRIQRVNGLGYQLCAPLPADSEDFHDPAL